MSGYATTLRTGVANPHPEPISGASYSAVELMPGDRSVMLLDQRKLPSAERYEFYTRSSDVADAIGNMVVRGAPAIGIAAAYAMVLAGGEAGPDFAAKMRASGEALRAARPTAVNLAHGVEAMMRASEEGPERLAEAARAYHRAEVEACRRMGEIGALQMPADGVVLTYCNAGALATGGFGSALGVIRAARRSGKNLRVVACETRPLFQGARLTAWELMKDQIPVTIITDSMVAQLMRKGEIAACIVGADRIARNGDVANKIGTYGVACLAKMHDVPFYVAAPWSTVDLACEDGSHIPIEERDVREVTHVGPPEAPFAVAPDAARAYNPGFDVTPAALVRAIYTERGEVSPVGEAALRVLG